MKLLRIIALIACIAMQINAQELKLHEKEYLNSDALSVLAFHNTYPSGMQAGIEIIQHNQRIASNGSVHYRLNPEFNASPDVTKLIQPIPEYDNPERIVHRSKNTIEILVNNEQTGLKYNLVITPIEDHAFNVEVNFDENMERRTFEEITFEMMFYTESYAGKSYISEHDYGHFPYNFSAKVDEDENVVPLMQGRRFILAPEDPSVRMEIISNAGEMKLIDDRLGSQRMWFKLIVKADLNVQKKAISLQFRPNIMVDWVKPPMISVSQVGYHPKQKKEAIIELQKGLGKISIARLKRLNQDGFFEDVESNRPKLWGDYLRYTYAIYDFSHITQPGLYRIEYEDQVTHIFKISNDIYRDGVWQPALETFIPVQMCHMRVQDRLRVWHAACHMDDALQAPAPLKFYDGFSQGDETDTQFEPNTTIPGLNVGGWHDAGDDDVNTGSSGRTVYHLALIIEEFGLNSDQTTVDFEKREVFLHQPDGVSDALQQAIHGVHWLLAQYRQIDHSIVGVISKDWNTYLQSADWGVFTDNLYYDPVMNFDEKDGTSSGKFDDRYAFTNKDSRREYMVAAILSASNRVLKDYDDKLANECLEVAQRIWNYEENHDRVFYPSVGTPRDLVSERANAAVELYLATKERKYIEAILDQRKDILNKIKSTGWTLSRIIDEIDDASFEKEYEKRLKEYSETITRRMSKSPFGIVAEKQVWGIGWNYLWFMQKHYYLIKNYPDLFPHEQLFTAVNYILGVHPGSNLSFVSGIGKHRPIPAFGLNRMDYSYIPGGVYSGTALISPDFPELKDDHPFLWQQSEYIVFGATPYIFCVLAADQFLND